MSYKNLAEYFKFNEDLTTKVYTGADSIKRALKRRGYSRRIALRKPPISEANRIIRLTWAHEHVHWTKEQWYEILWSDETWVTGGHHRKIYITRKPGEELDPTCIIEKVQRKSGWMFWGCFHGSTKGPGLFWEKDWGSINTNSYQQHTIPIVHGWIKIQKPQQLLFMQDNAPGHAATETRADIRDRGIRVIFWPSRRI